MALLLVADGAFRRIVPLAGSCLVGRGAACLVQIRHPLCPAHWLEVRWRGDGWTWRALSALERTRGTGAFLPDGWRTFDVSAERGTRISIVAGGSSGDSAFVELVDASPPEPFVWDLLADVPIVGEELETVAEVRGADIIPLDAEGDPHARIADGACWVQPTETGPRVFRAYLPERLPDTLGTRIDLSRGEVTASVDLAATRCALEQSGVRVLVTGQAVRLLAVYYRARQEDPAKEGWLTANEAWAIWLEFGGAESAPIEAVAWERTRLRQLLARARVGSVEALFERRKVGAFVQIRLAACIESVDTLS